jgi:hypothetical protein
VALYSDQQAIDSTRPFGRAMMQMATVFAELERSMIRARVVAGLDRVRAEGKKSLGRPKIRPKVEQTIRDRLTEGHGILKMAKIVGVGSGTVQRVRKEMAASPEAIGVAPIQPMLSTVLDSFHRRYAASVDDRPPDHLHDDQQAFPKPPGIAAERSRWSFSAPD